MLDALCELCWLILILCNASGTVVTINLNMKNLSKITQLISGMSGPLPQVIPVLRCLVITGTVLLYGTVTLFAPWESSPIAGRRQLLNPYSMLMWDSYYYLIIYYLF